MKTKALIFLAFFCVIRWGNSYAQLAVDNGTTLNMTPDQLLQQFLVGQGVVISNATYNGSTGIIADDQIGSFESSGNAIMQLGLNSGLIMTSGKASIAIGPNNIESA